MEGIGRGCSRRAVQRGGENLGRMSKREGEGEERGRQGSLAITRVLGRCVDVVGRVVRGRGDVLLGGKVLVLARLLHKSLSSGDGAANLGVLEDLRRKLGIARKRLLGYISRTLVKRGGDTATTIKALCAYSLISSSSPKEVLRYFMQVRFEQLEAQAEIPTAESVLEMLDLYSQTLLDTKDLFPRRFADALAQLSKSALIRDESVQAVYELSLDVYEQWIPDDVRNFHFWVRHDQQLSASEVGVAMASWTKQAQACLLQALKDALAMQSDAEAVLAMRRQVISKYLSLSAKLRNEEHARAVDDIRIAFLEKLEELADQAAKMSDLTIDTLQYQHQQQKSDAPAKMWDLATEDLSDLKGGSASFRQAVMDRQHGRSPATQNIRLALDAWMQNLRRFKEVVDAMRVVKWDDDDLELELDDLTDCESLQKTLRIQDPEVLEGRLRRAVGVALRGAYRRVEELGEEVDPGLVVRVLRDVDLRRRGVGDVFVFEEGEEEMGKVGAGEEFIAGLHRRIAERVCEKPLEKYREERTRAVVALWDGTPALPVQPSTGVYRFVKDLQRGMAEVGDDLWSWDAVGVLKGVVGQRLGEMLSSNDSLEEIGEREKKDEKPVEENETTSPDATGEDEAESNRRVQILFDVLYLQRIFTVDGKLEKAAVELEKKVDLGEKAEDRLKRSAGEYWRRTFLLFGLLAGSSGQ